MSWRAFLESASKGPTLNILRYGVKATFPTPASSGQCHGIGAPDCVCSGCNPRKEKP